MSISVSNTKVIPYYPEETSDMIDNGFGTVIFESSIINGNSDPNKDKGMERGSINVRYVIINVEHSGQGTDEQIIPPYSQKMVTYQPKEWFWAVFDEKINRRSW